MMIDINYHGPVVVFDLDDTLIRERDFVRAGFELIRRELMRRYGPSAAGVAMRLTSRLVRRENYFELLKDILGKITGRDEAAVEAEASQLMQLYRESIPEKLPLLPEVEETLQELQRRGVVMAVVTDGRSVTQRNKIKGAGLDRYIAPYNVFISEEVGCNKTEPQSFQEIVRRYPEAKQFLYVGDNAEKDFIMPNLMGWKTLKVPYNFDNVHPEVEIDDILKAPTVNLYSFSNILENL